MYKIRKCDGCMPPRIETRTVAHALLTYLYLSLTFAGERFAASLCALLLVVQPGRALVARAVQRRHPLTQPVTPRRTRIALGDVLEADSRRIAPDGAAIAHFDRGRAAPPIVSPRPTILAHRHVGRRVGDVAVFSRIAREALVPANSRLGACCWRSILSVPPRRAAFAIDRRPARVGARSADKALGVEPSCTRRA